LLGLTALVQAYRPGAFLQIHRGIIAMTTSSSQNEAPRFAIFKAKDARPYSEMTNMQFEPMSPAAAEGVQRVTEVGYDNGHNMKQLFAAPGFSLIRLWFKSSFPLPRHNHDVDCLYYIVAGSLRIGHEELGVGDGFFVGKGVPYTYTPGHDGVEVLEFRAADAFAIKVLADDRRYWDKAVETVRNLQSVWSEETPPSGDRA
jgi:hypothetical protein